MITPSCNSGGIQKIYIINPADFVWKNGAILRKKRKYGKFTRKSLDLISFNDSKYTTNEKN